MAYGDQGAPLQLRYPKLSQYFTPAVCVFLGLQVVGVVLLTYAPNWTKTWLMLYPRDVLRGQVWKLVTYMLVTDAGGVVFGGLGLLLCGSAIEREWRSRSFAILCLVVGVVCGVLWTVVGLIIGIFSSSFVAAGWSFAGCTYGIMGAFALIFRRQKVASFFFIMEAQHLVLLIAGIGVVLSIPRPIALIWVAGAGVGYLYAKLRVGIRLPRPRKSKEDASRFADID